MPDYIQAAALPFAPLLGIAPLMRSAFRNEDLGPVGEVLLARARDNPGDANAFLDCSIILQLMGNPDIALLMQKRALQMQKLYSLPTRQAQAGLRLLVIKGPGALMWNTPIELLMEDSDISMDVLYLTLDAPWPESVPEHDVMFVAVAESDANLPLLQLLGEAVANWPRPVINLPERIAALSRDGACALLGDVPGVEMPITARADRATLQALCKSDEAAKLALEALLPGDDFPLIVRPLDSHAGKNLEKIECGGELAGYLGRIDGENFYVSRFVDYRNADGLYRKYRVALIEGRPFVCHFAVSAHWMVHYLNAGMAESPEKRAEEAECMAHFDEQFAARHAAALQAAYQRMGLPYVLLDCAETPAGGLLIFEVGNAMAAHAMDDEALYPYKQPAMRKVFAAFRQMLYKARAPATAA
jgi:glutathione synthase/RimK-type ligase-like ATP-grasp enzyme